MTDVSVEEIAQHIRSDISDVDTYPICDGAKRVELLTRMAPYWRAAFEGAVRLDGLGELPDDDRIVAALARNAMHNGMMVSIETLQAEASKRPDILERAAGLTTNMVEHYRSIGMDIDPDQFKLVPYRDAKSGKVVRTLVYCAPDGLPVSDIKQFLKHSYQLPLRSETDQGARKEYIFDQPYNDVRIAMTLDLYKAMVAYGYVSDTDTDTIITGGKDPDSWGGWFQVVSTDESLGVCLRTESVTDIAKCPGQYRIRPAVKIS